MLTMNPNANGQHHAVIGTNVFFVLALTPYQSVLKGPIFTHNLQGIPKACTLKLEKMYHWLCLYPDRQEAQVLIEGFSIGFRLPEFSDSGCHLVNNLKSVDMYSHRVRDKLIKEISAGRAAGAFHFSAFQKLSHFLTWFGAQKRA